MATFCRPEKWWMTQMPSFYEFFAGGGMARIGLGPKWKCLFANDLDEKKAASYRTNHQGGAELLVKDVGKVTTAELPGIADLIWASFPCQDLSLAGMGAGLRGSRSGTFWPFWERVQSLKTESRQPALVVLENVCGALTSHGGQDFRSLILALRRTGYRAGALVIDAALFVPHSRPRLFIVGVRNDVDLAPELFCQGPQYPFHTSAVVTAFEGLSDEDKESWIWWYLPTPARRRANFADLIEEDVPWHAKEKTQALLRLMSPINRAKVAKAQKSGLPMVGTIYKRTRLNENGEKTQRAEVRFDDVAGCLRTPGGGSSRQSILVVRGAEVRSRLLSPREAARLMGLQDRYVLPTNYNDAYHLMGDGVAVPVVRHLAKHILERILAAIEQSAQRAA
jgi:DNA (cytosine-5)-methyltransferase 1